jgi:ketosteroid isomerase-like protein
MDTREAARRWAAVWQSAWESHDVAAIAALYADDALFQSHPFRAPEPAADYVARVFGEESGARALFAEPLVDGGCAVVEWRAQTQLRSGGEEALSGVSLLRFDKDGRVVEQRDIWCQSDEHESAARDS